MGIAILRQNRWVALLVGALFVSLSLINLLGMQTNANEGKKPLPAAETAAESAPGAGTNVTGKVTFDNKDRGFPVLFSSNQFHKWKPIEQEASLSFPVPGIKGSDFTAGAKSELPRASPNLRRNPVLQTRQGPRSLKNLRGQLY
ncbi:hypothetical protein [Paenibacillus sp. DMB20]|uniref:hypothetical protein n=1 Tax=Paenibacillus sp. DMB20 TaxID=1642570 RepID=UPI000A447A36|nr:hypothetical protein [Paenibacillus sp. DMB20]